MPIFPGGFWYKQHCLTITPYLSAQIRYREQGKEWVYVDGDDYSLEQETMRCQTSYEFSYRLRPADFFDWDYKSTRTTEDRFPPFDDFKFIFDANNGEDAEGFPILRAGVTNKRAKGDWYFSYSYHDVYGNKLYFRSPSSLKRSYFNAEGTAEWLGAAREDGEPDNCGQCILTITRVGQIIFEQTFDECPEVEKLDRSLGEPVKLDIETSPLGFIEVTNTHQSFDADDDDIEQIPDECWDVYNVIPSIPIGFSPTAYDASSPGATRINKFIGQYCSTKGSPRPEVDYQEGSCDKCESCPENTCPVTCGDRVCCYGNDGVAVKSISLENYCD